MAQEVSVVGGISYLLLTTSECADRDDEVEVTVRWFDHDARELGSTMEAVIPGKNWSEQFLWYRAPIGAASVSVEIAAERCTFDQVELYDLS